MPRLRLHGVGPPSHIRAYGAMLKHRDSFIINFIAVIVLQRLFKRQLWHYSCSIVPIIIW